MRSKIVLTGLVGCLALGLACSKESASPASPTSVQSAGAAPVAADGSTLKVTPPAPVSPINDTQLNDAPTLVVNGSTAKFTTTPALQYRFEVYDDTNQKVVDSGVQASTSYKVTANLAFKKRHTWRARAELNGDTGPWSSFASFVTSEGGYLRANEVFDPLTNNVTVGERIGPTTFMGDKGIRLDSVGSYVRYLIPQTITSGEFSMEVQGLRANAPGDKSKVFGMQQGTDDYITNPYRVDIQYRGTGGFPPNSITFRALYGSGDDLAVRYEPTTEVRLASVYNLNPDTVYYWKATWGSQFRVVVKEGGINGREIYNVARNSPNGTYNPQPMYAFIGTPTGRSGAESASIPGTIYRNVWISGRPRP